MNKNIYIYGGLYKTASEFLSEKYFEELDKKRFTIYSSYKKKNNFIYSNFLKIVNGEISLNMGKKIIIEHLSDVSTPNILISSTGFYAHRYTAHHDVENRFFIMEEIFNKPKYIVIIRNQKTAIYSQWHAGLKKRVKISFKEYTDADMDFLKSQKLPDCKELTNYKCFDYNEVLKPYIKLLNNDSKRVNISIYEELKKTPLVFLNKINKFLIGQNLNTEIDYSYKNKTNLLEETNLKCFLYFKNLHIFILNIIYIFFKLFKFIGFKLDIKPPYKNYKFERTLNLFSLFYLSLIEKYLFKFFYLKKNKNYYVSKMKRLEEIKLFYKDKNFFLEKKIKINLKKFDYY